MIRERVKRCATVIHTGFAKLPGVVLGAGLAWQPEFTSMSPPKNISKACYCYRQDSCCLSSYFLSSCLKSTNKIPFEWNVTLTWISKGSKNSDGRNKNCTACVALVHARQSLQVWAKCTAGENTQLTQACTNVCTICTNRKDSSGFLYLIHHFI